LTARSFRIFCIAALSLLLFLPQIHATAATEDGSPAESCHYYEPRPGMTYAPSGPEPCFAMVRDLRIQPTDGGAIVSWTPTTQSIKSFCGPYGEPSNCLVTGYRVVVTFDPVTKSGGGSCTAPTGGQPSCLLTGLRNGVRYKVFLDSMVNFTLYRYAQPDAEAFTPCCSVALAPTAVTASLIGNAADVQWIAPSDWGGAEELTYRAESMPGGRSCETKTLTCRIDGLSFGQSYSFNVTAGNSAGGSPIAQSAQFPLPKSVPDSPTGGAVRYQRGDASVAWTAPRNDGGWRISSYRVTSNPGRRTCSTTGSTLCVVQDLVGGRDYSFTVQALNSAGASPPSPPIVAGRLVTPASTPRSVQGSLSDRSAVIQWLPPRSMGGGSVKYVVRSTPQSETCVTVRNSCKINGLQPGTAYTFSVYAVNNSGQGPSAETTQLSIPAPIALKPAQPIS
jgi:hypothetical protein